MAERVYFRPTGKSKLGASIPRAGGQHLLWTEQSGPETSIRSRGRGLASISFVLQ
ncbi:hypothetical protein BGW80DRAFT_893324 [Lactifluus volemus]|nr:hypothetical protein BGW80DRAFT_893324 [Lactifluus volemus]